MHYISDSSPSLTYYKQPSIIATKLGEPASLNITMIAFPADVTFHWFFNGTNNTWESISTTIEGYNITNRGLTSYLYIADFQAKQAGHYKVYGNNSVKAGRDYKFELPPDSKCSIISISSVTYHP